MPPYRKFPPPHGRCTAPAAAPPATYPPARYSAPHILQPHNLRPYILRPIFGKSPTRRTVERQRPIFRTELLRQHPFSCVQGHTGFIRLCPAPFPAISQQAQIVPLLSGPPPSGTRRRKKSTIFLAIKAKNRYLCSDATGRLAAFRTHFGHRITPIPYL